MPGDPRTSATDTFSSQAATKRSDTDAGGRLWICNATCWPRVASIIPQGDKIQPHGGEGVRMAIEQNALNLGPDRLTRQGPGGDVARTPAFRSREPGGVAGTDSPRLPRLYNSVLRRERDSEWSPLADVRSLSIATDRMNRRTKIAISSHHFTSSARRGTPPSRSTSARRPQRLSRADTFQSWRARRSLQQSSACLRHRPPCPQPNPGGTCCP
jgi:hypothetical protein